MNNKLSFTLLGVKFENPFLVGSAPTAGSYEMCAKALRKGWAGVVYKTVSINPCDECSPRFDVINKQTANWVGFKNMEQLSEKTLEANLNSIRKLKEDFPSKVIIGSIMGEDIEQWIFLTKKMNECNVDMIELNFSCPQMSKGVMGDAIGVNPELVHDFIKAVKSVTNKPIIAKMTPNITTLVPIIKAAQKASVDCFAAINTVKSITNVYNDSFDYLSKQKNLYKPNCISGLSGKAIKPIGLRFVKELTTEVDYKKVPICGIGGIYTYKDAIDFLSLGSSFLQVVTAILEFGYDIIDDLNSGLLNFLEKNNLNNVLDLVGLYLNTTDSHKNIDRSYKIIPSIDKAKCIGCLRCYQSCYDGGHQAIEISNDKPNINEEKCVGCGLCHLVCPSECIYGDKIIKKR